MLISKWISSLLSMSIVPLIFLITFLQIQIDFINYYFHGPNSVYEILLVNNFDLNINWFFYSFYCFIMITLTYKDNRVLLWDFYLPKLMQNILYGATLLFMSIFAFKIYHIGMTEYFISARQGVLSIGFLGYAILLFGPISAAIALRNNRNIIFICLFSMLVFFNLVTGFRLLLIWAFIVLYFFCFEKVSKINPIKFIFGILLFAIAMFGYEIIRQYSESGSFDQTNTYIDSLNRGKILYTIVQLQNTDLKFFDSLSTATYCEVVLVINEIMNSQALSQCSLDYKRDIVFSIWKSWILNVYGNPEAVSGISVPLMALLLGLSHPILLSFFSIVFVVLRKQMTKVKLRSEFTFIVYFQFSATMIMASEAVNEAAKLFFYISTINLFLLLGITLKAKYYARPANS